MPSGTSGCLDTTYGLIGWMAGVLGLVSIFGLKMLALDFEAVVDTEAFYTGLGLMFG